MKINEKETGIGPFLKTFLVVDFDNVCSTIRVN